MTGSKGDQAVNLACAELVDAILNLPDLNSTEIKPTHVEIAINSMMNDDWEIPSGTSVIKNDNTVLEDLVKLSMEPLRLRDDSITLSVKTFSSSDWTSTVSMQSGSMNQSTPDVSYLPDGLREFMYQVEFLYGTAHAEGRITKTELVESIGSSQHLTIVFPHIVRFAVDRIRTVSRQSSVSELLELLQAVVVNPHYVVKNHGDFQIILNCLLGLVVDPNLMENDDETPRQTVRKYAAEILSHFLKSKLGIHHSTRHANQIIDELLIPFITQALKHPAGVWSSITGAVFAVAMLVHNFMNGRLQSYNSPLVKSLANAMSRKNGDIDPVCLDILKQVLAD